MYYPFNFFELQNDPYAFISLMLFSLMMRGLLVYCDSSCPACQRVQRFLQLRHQRWRDWGFPLVYIALDSDQKNLQQNFGTTPWALYFDEKSWDSPWVCQADIQATPTLLALDRNLNQLYEVASVAQMDLWLIKNKSDFNLPLVE